MGGKLFWETVCPTRLPTTLELPTQKEIYPHSLALPHRELFALLLFLFKSHIPGPSFVGSFAHFPSSIWPPNVWLPRDLAWVLFQSFQNNLFLSHSLKCHVNVNVPHQISLPDISMNYKLIYSSACFVFPRSNESCLKPNPPQTPSSTFFPISVTPLSAQNMSHTMHFHSDLPQVEMR